MRLQTLPKNPKQEWKPMIQMKTPPNQKTPQSQKTIVLPWKEIDAMTRRGAC